jgi:hypothetical protein
VRTLIKRILDYSGVYKCSTCGTEIELDDTDTPDGSDPYGFTHPQQWRGYKYCPSCKDHIMLTSKRVEVPQ